MCFNRAGTTPWPRARGRYFVFVLLGQSRVVTEIILDRRLMIRPIKRQNILFRAIAGQSGLCMLLTESNRTNIRRKAMRIGRAHTCRVKQSTRRSRDRSSPTANPTNTTTELTHTEIRRNFLAACSPGQPGSAENSGSQSGRQCVQERPTCWSR